MMILNINKNISLMIALYLGAGIMFQRLTFESVFNNIGIRGTTKMTALNFYCSISQTDVCRPLSITTLYLINVGWISKWLSSPQRMALPVAEFGTLPFPKSFPTHQSLTIGSPQFHFKFCVLQPWDGRGQSRAGEGPGRLKSRWG